jgi:hypothetical protein
MVDALVGNRIENELRRGVPENRRPRAARHGDQRDVNARDVEERHRRQHCIAGFVIQAARSRGELESGEIIAVGQANPFGAAGGARRVDLDHVVLRVRLEPRVARGRGFDPYVAPLVAFSIKAERDHPRLRGKRGDRPVREVGDICANHENPGAAVLEQAGDLRRGEAKVERRERRARFAGAKQAGQKMIGVLAEIRDPLLRPDAGRDQRVGDARRHRVYVREGHRPAVEYQRGLVATKERLHPRHIRHAGYAFELDHRVSNPTTALRCSLPFFGDYARLVPRRNPPRFLDALHRCVTRLTAEELEICQASVNPSGSPEFQRAPALCRNSRIESSAILPAAGQASKEELR